MIPMPPIIATWPSLIREGGGLQPAGQGFTVTSHLGGRSPRGYKARCSRAGGYRQPWEARRIGTGVQEGVGDESQGRRLVGDQGHDNRALGPAGAYYGGALRGRLASLRGAVAHPPAIWRRWFPALLALW